MNPSPRMAMIGLGVMASRMITNMNNHGDFDITAGWDPSPDACGRIKTLEPGIRIGASAAEIIAADDTDFVYIA
ncbi:MAG: gfo/Idh/MocA family oxidoreductase, partial [Rhodospirillaceae bacterium]|nr:gfo/Idh/MocA family oxidoreductase [Rhodospirillaceae bacterium]